MITKNSKEGHKEIIDMAIEKLAKKGHAVMYNTSFCEKECISCLSKTGCHLLSVQLAVYAAYESLLLNKPDGVKKQLQAILTFVEAL